MYEAQGKTIVFRHRCGDVDARAECDNAKEAAALLNHAGHLNNERRQYTAAARTIARAECLPGFRWIDGMQS